MAAVKKNVKKTAKKKAAKPAKKAASALKTGARKAAVKKTVVKKAAPRKKAVKKAVALKTVVKKIAAKKVLAKKAVVKKAVAKKAGAKKGRATKVVAKKIATKKVVTKKAAFKKTALKKAAPKKSLAKKNPARKPVASKPVAKKPVVRNALAKKSAAPKIVTAPEPLAEPAPQQAAIETLVEAVPVAPQGPYGLPEQLRDAALKILDERQAEDVVTASLAGRSAVADYLIIASGRVGRQIAAIADYLQEAFFKLGVRNVRIEGKAEANWVLVDAGDIVVHLFRPEVRAYYDLDAIYAKTPGAAA